MKKRYQHIELPPHLEAFRKNYLAATEVEATLCGIITCYKMYGAYFIRTKSSLTGKRVKRDKRFRRTMYNAGILALASEWITPVYNSLTEDWRCQDLYRKLVGLGVKLLHQGATGETVQQAAWDELTQLGYRTEWPEWDLPPELLKWVEEEGDRHKKLVQAWVVNEKGKLVFERLTSNAHPLSTDTIDSIASGVTCLQEEVAMPPPV
ncbi:hypothetical protein [Paraflavitalea soli]|nr:hypothetical protein [Paraflavitalea soli]